ncbi:MAG TPA: 4Fe-4S dicluster domain-containing protein [Spirochaetota bacterium]|nr:4Fe-4S dicluster domain-containing protein [Spirochaetota bacterium]
MLRDIITIDKDKCNGCGDCIPGCPEGALQIIDGKARLISDLMCDGLGACIGDCPSGALTIEKKEAEPYDEKKVMKNIIKAGPNTIRAHLKHLKEHGEKVFLKEAVAVLSEKGLNPADYIIREKKPSDGPGMPAGCPGSRLLDRREDNSKSSSATAGTLFSELKQWPVQLHLLPPVAPFFKNADLVLAADCAAYAAGDFHSRFLKGKSLAIACPKLDQGQESYLKKMRLMIDEGGVNTITVVMMQVPCCRTAAAGQTGCKDGRTESTFEKNNN